MRPSQEYGLDLKFKKNQCFTTVFNHACAEMNTGKWCCSHPSTVSPQSRARLLASPSYTAAKTEASVTHLWVCFLKLPVAFVAMDWSDGRNVQSNQPPGQKPARLSRLQLPDHKHQGNDVAARNTEANS